ncbi:cobalamin biosynthesis protein CbiL [Pseudooceanicola sp. 502str34]
MRRLLTALLLVLGLAGPVLAHSLRVFATVEGAEVTGYGFFVGGGRPQAVTWTATMAGRDIAQGQTDSAGGFAFPVPVPVEGTVTVTINSGEGHIASRAFGPERFGAAAPPLQAEAAPEPAGASPTAEVTPEMIRTMTRTAVAQEVAPLLERIEAMDARMRLTDVISGLCLIFGIAGIALWARGRRS